MGRTKIGGSTERIRRKQKQYNHKNQAYKRQKEIKNGKEEEEVKEEDKFCICANTFRNFVKKCMTVYFEGYKKENKFQIRKEVYSIIHRRIQSEILDIFRESFENSRKDKGKQTLLGRHWIKTIKERQNEENVHEYMELWVIGSSEKIGHYPIYKSLDQLPYDVTEEEEKEFTLLLLDFISNRAIKRLSKKAGINRIHNHIYTLCRIEIHHLLLAHLSKCVGRANEEGKKTLMKRHCVVF